MHIDIQHRDTFTARVVVQTGNLMPRADEPSFLASNPLNTSECLCGFPPEPSV
jgi:hypothetical protein